MDCEKVGRLIKALRCSQNMTQKELAAKLNISDKAVSKWERGFGMPDISLLEQLSHILGVNIEGILSGSLEENDTVGGNMKNLKYYVCPECGNIITAMSDTAISCCGRKLCALEAQKADERHRLSVTPVEDEYFITSAHPMTKEHHISFTAFATGDTLTMMKHYPEWELQRRCHKSGHGKLLFYCTQHGLFYQLI